MEGTELRDQANATLVTNKMDVRLTSSPVDGRERIKIEFYKTYDVMTGIRIAATLGGFFSMMILLVLYKNYCKPSKTLSEEQLNAAVTAAVEEEDRALKAALEATSFYTSLSEHRQSSTVEEAPAIMSPRFSSVGGGCSHLTPPVRFSYLQQRGKSLPGSALRFGAEEVEAECPKGAEPPREEEPRENNQAGDYVENRNYLSLLPPDRRLSSVTCSSGDTSYLERRGSAFEMGHPAPPFFIKSTADENKFGEGGPWDFYYPIDIQVIQPTPEISPAPSAETLCEKPDSVCKLQVPGFNDIHRLSADISEAGVAPLASISSLASLSFPSSTVRPSRNQTREAVPLGNDDSVGSDSVFIDEEVYTEDEVDEFSTDSEFEYGGFDDDYSFCESSKKPADKSCVSNGGGDNNRGNPRFASFDSYDASIGRDSISEGNDKTAGDKAANPTPRRNPSPNAGKRKLSKTHSEPRSQTHLRHLQPPRSDKARSEFAPKRQLSVPAPRRKSKGKNVTGKEENLFRGGGSSNNRDSPPSQSIRKEDKRKRLQKQKTVNEEEPPVPSSEPAPGRRSNSNSPGAENGKTLAKERA